MPFALGDLIDGHYRVENTFTGGMGTVYIVHDELVGKRFAIKQLAKEAAEGKKRERFLREASSWLQLDHHPHIVQAHSFLPHDEGPMLILEFIDGPSLDRLLHAERRISPAQAVSYAGQFCRAMQYAGKREISGRGAGLVHRDIKPANILITRTNQLKVTDFGLAKLAGDRALTTEGQFVGTVMYSSPEQLRSAANVTVASDVYSFGCVLYEMLAGRPPFVRKDLIRLFRAIQDDEPEPLGDCDPSLPRSLVQIVHRCLSKRPDRRIGDFAELEEMLQRLKSLKKSSDWECATCGYVRTRGTTECPVCGTECALVSGDSAVDQSAPTIVAGGPAAPRTVADREEFLPLLPDRADGDDVYQATQIDVPEGDNDVLAFPTLAGEPDSEDREEVLVTADESKLDLSGWDLEAHLHYLVELRRDGTLVPCKLEKPVYTVGRAATMRIRLHDPEVAGFQMLLTRLDCGWVAINSVPGSWFQVNGQRTRQRILRAGDLLQLGATWLVFVGPPTEAQRLPRLAGIWSEHVQPKEDLIEAETFSFGGDAQSEPATCRLELPDGTVVETRGQPLRLGTAPICDLRLRDVAAAPIHALLAWHVDGPHLIGVTDRTFESDSGERLTDHELADGDRLLLGTTQIQVAIDGTPSWDQIPDQDTATHDLAVTVLSGPQLGQSAILPVGRPLILGRHSKCDLQLKSDPHISRSHVELTASGSDVSVKDVTGRHGFYINQTKHTDRAVAHPGAVLKVGKTSLLIHHDFGIAGTDAV